MNSYSVNKQRWAGMTFFEQMGNTGSEVGRAFSAIRRGNAGESQAAAVRALDLFDATAAKKQLGYPKLKELLRAREQFLVCISSEDPQQSLEDYFTQFAVAARINR